MTTAIPTGPSVLAPPSRRDRHGTATGAVLGAATVATGLTAGVYYGFAVGVMPGLAGADDRTFVVAMQRINDAIQNPGFFAGFFGALVLPGAAAILARHPGVRRWTVAGLVFYTAGFAVTVGLNVPLNEQLTAADGPDGITDLTAVREQFEGAWNTWNVVRALASTAAVGCLTRALVLHGRRARE